MRATTKGQKIVTRPHKHVTCARMLPATVALGLWLAAAGAEALCGDPSGDGFVLAGDALKILRAAVAGDYDRRADVEPAGGDGKLLAGDALAVLRAAVSGSLLRCAGADQRRVVVSTAAFDFSSAGIATVGIDDHQVNWRSGSVGNDSVIRWQGGKAVIVNRKGFDSLQVIDTVQASLPTVKECSVSDGFDSNPQDVLLLSASKGYVTLYAGRKLLVIDPRILDPAVDPACSGLIVKRIDLGAFDGDSVPDMDQMVVVDGKLFVSLQRLDPFPQVSAPGKLAVIDTATDTVVAGVDLSISNPFAATKGLVYDEFQDRIYVSGPGIHADDLSDGGIEVVNPHTMQSEGVLVTGEQLGGDLFDFVLAGSARAYGIVAGATTNSVVEIDLAAGKISDVLLSSIELISDIELTETGQLWVAWREDGAKATPGLRIFRISDNSELTATPIYTGSLPFTLTFAP